MISFFKSILSIRQQINNNPLIVGVIGDSIARGTSNGIGDSVDNTLFEFNGTNLIEIENDTLEAFTGSPYPSMAARFFEITNRVTHLVNAAEGGAEFSPNGDTENYSITGSLYQAFLNKANSYFINQNVSKFDIIRITLGINDARGNTALATIEADSISLIERLNTDFPNTKILINQLGKSSANTTRVNAIRGYIDNLVSTYQNVYAGKDLNEYDASFYYDGLHLNQSGNNQLGIADAEIINSLM